jgi:hypothetical protein
MIIGALGLMNKIVSYMPGLFGLPVLPVSPPLAAK